MNTFYTILKYLAVVAVVGLVFVAVGYAALKDRTVEAIRTVTEYKEVEVGPFTEVDNLNDAILGKLDEVKSILDEVSVLESQRDAILDEVASSTEAQREKAREIEMGFTQVQVSVE